MKKIIAKLFRKKNKPEVPHGEKGIEKVGYKDYVGGLWDEIGKLQIEFLKEQGLKPSHIFIDVACGSLRAGRFLIPYLETGNYLGIDKEQSLINAGLSYEIDSDILLIKKPEFLISVDFEFSKFSRIPEFGIAQSLFTHLPPDLINLCFKKLYHHYIDNGVFFATYFITDKHAKNPDKPHDHGIFKYTYDEVIAFGENNGWLVEIIGEWNHPRKQQMIKYIKS